MTDNITLPRSVIEQALEAFEQIHSPYWHSFVTQHIAALRAALEQGSGVLNQCDGCMQGAPLRGIFHTDESGKSFMTCQKRKYTHPQNLNCKSNQHRLATLWGYEKPQPNRQPLTDEEILKLGWAVTPYANQMEMLSIARAIERAHGIGGEE